MQFRRLAVVGIASAALVFSSLPAVTSSQATVQGTVNPVRPTSTGTVAYAALTWSGSLSGQEFIHVNLLGASPGSGVLEVIDDTGVGTTDPPMAQVTVGQPYVGTGISPASGSTGRVGIRVSEAGTYNGTLEVRDQQGLIETVNFSFTTTGVPASLRVTPGSASDSVGATVSLTVEVLDANGNVTQPQATDSLSVSSTLGTVTPSSISASGDPTTSLSNGAATVSVTSATAGTATVTATGNGTMLGLNSATSTVAFNAAPPPPPPPAPAPRVVAWGDGESTPGLGISGPALAGVPLSQISAGNGFACALSLGGQVYCWGSGSVGQLGNGETGSAATPVAVSTTGALDGKILTDVSTGGSFTCAVDSDGDGYCWGPSQYLGAGLGDYYSVSRPVALDPFSAVASRNLVDIDAGTAHACAIDDQGQAYCWGSNSSGRLGDGSTTDRLSPVRVSTPQGVTWSQISAGGGHTCAITSTGQAYCWGGGSNGQLGNGLATDSSTPVQVSAPQNKTWTSVTTGSSHTCAVTDDGSAYCWGRGNSGELGNGQQSWSNTTPQLVTTPQGVLWASISAEATHTCAMTTTGSSYCWGLGTSGQLGNSASTSSTEPVLVSGEVSWTTVSAGSALSCGIASFAAYCWGWNAGGALGTGTAAASSNQPSAVATSTDLDRAVISDIAVGPSHRCVISSGRAYCWGSGSVTNTATPVPVSTDGVLNGKVLVDVEIGAGHTCAIDSLGDVYCWGFGFNGQLGNSARANSSAPVAVESDGALAGKTVVDLALAGNTSCALTSDGTVVCWGQGDRGQLGNGSSGGRVVPVPIDDSNIPGNEVIIDIASRVYVDPVMGENRSDYAGFCALTNAGSVYCWGYSSDLVLQTYVNSLLPIPAGLSSPPDGINLQDMTLGFRASFQYSSTGPQHVCALDQNGSVYCAGGNSQGQLGRGNSGNASSTWQPVTTGTLPQSGIVSLDATGASTCAADGQGRVYCWGENDRGQLGDGTTTNRLSPVAVDTTGVLSGIPVTQVAGANFRFWVSTDPGPMPPAAPDRPTVTAADQSLTVSWTPPADTGSASITGYRVRYSSNGGVTWTAVSPDFDSATRSAVLNGLVNGQPYVTQVAAITTVGTGAWSASSASTSPRTTPGAPTNLAANAGDGRVELTWQAPDDTGGAAISGYEIGISPAGGQVTYSGVTATVTGLTNATAYTFTVAARNIAGTGPASSPISATPQAGPGMPVNLQGTPQDREVTLTWTAPSPVAGVTITGYTIQSSADGGSTWTVDVADTGSTSTTRQITGLNNGQGYRFRVAARAGQIQGEWSSTSAVIVPRTVPAAPLNLLVSPGDRRLSVSWAEPGDGGSAIQGYRIDYSSDNGSNWQTAVSDTGNNSLNYTISGLANGTPYLVRVAAINLAGSGAWVQTANTVTPIAAQPVDLTEDPALAAPAQICPSASNRAITLNWNAAPNASGYVVEYRSGNDTWSQLTPLNGTTVTVDGLTNETRYEFRVAALASGDRRSTWGTGCLMSWGSNSTYSLGIGNSRAASTPTKITTAASSPITGVHAGWQSACFVTESNDPYCWGSNAFGQLGTGNWILTRPTNVLAQWGLNTDVQTGALGTASTCFTNTLDYVECLGRNFSGELGRGNTSGNSSIPALVTGVLQGVTVAQLSVGEAHACAVTTSGRVACWGNNIDGQVNPTQNSIVPTSVWVEDILAGQRVTHVSAGQSHTCALTDTGRVACWGSDYYGQIGDGPAYTNRTSPTWVKGVVDSASGAGETIRALDAGSNHTCAVTDAGRIACWGSNSSGQLGVGTRFPHGSPKWVRSPIPPSGFDVISAGGAFTCASGKTVGVHCWGLGSRGQLGIGRKATKTRAQPVLGRLYGSNASALSAGGEFVVAQWGGVATPGAPSLAPQSLRVTMTGTTANLDWKRPVISGAAPISQYRVQRRPSSGGDWVTVATPVMTSAAVALPAEGYWQFRVIPVTEIGAGDPSEVVEALRIPTSRVIRLGVTIRLLTQWGAPMSGTRVTWSTLDGIFDSAASVTTNSNGTVVIPEIPTGPIRFTFSGGTDTVRSLALEEAIVTKTVGASGDVTMVLPGSRQPESRTVTIRMPDGNPVPNAVLSINGGLTGTRNEVRSTGARTDQALWRVNGFANSVVADALGRVTVSGLPRSTSTRDVTARYSNGYLRQTRSFRLVENTQVLFEQMPVVRILTTSVAPVTAGQSTQLTIKAIDQDGSPLANYNVRMERVTPLGVAAASSRVSAASCSNPSATTDSAGNATISLCPTTSGQWRAAGDSVVPSAPIAITVNQPTPPNGGGGGGLPPGGGGGAPVAPPVAPPVDPPTDDSTLPTPTPSPSPEPEVPREPQPAPITERPKPGSAQGLIGGRPDPNLAVTPDVESGDVTIEGSGFTLDLAGESSQGAKQTLTESGALRVPNDGAVRLQGGGFAQNGTVEAFLDPPVSGVGIAARVLTILEQPTVYLGGIPTDDEGNLAGELVIPDSIEPGERVLQLIGTTATGDDVVLVLGIAIEVSQEEVDPEPVIGAIDLPASIRTKRGARVRLVLQVQTPAPVEDLRLIARVKRKNTVVKTRFAETRGGDVRAVFRAKIRPGRHRVVLVQIVDGKRVVLDRARLIVRR